MQVSVQTRAMPFDVQARLQVGARLQHLQSERGALVAKLQALSDPQDVEMYEQVRASRGPAQRVWTPPHTAALGNPRQTSVLVCCMASSTMHNQHASSCRQQSPPQSCAPTCG